MMIADFADCCLWLCVVIDELWQQLPPAYKRRGGPAPGCSERELLTLALVGECRGGATETTLLSRWAAYPQLFPLLPERSRFNRRRRRLRHALDAIRQAVLAVRDVAQDRQCALDSPPVPVLAFHVVPGAAGTRLWRAAGADFGKVPTKQQTSCGDTLHLLAPASASAVAVGAELLREQHDVVVVGDKGDIGTPLAHELREEHAVTLLTVPRRNQRPPLPAAVAQRRNSVRRIIETVDDHLTAPLGLARHHAPTLHGLCARLHTTLAAHTRCPYLNRLLGHAAFLQIKALAFPTNEHKGPVASNCSTLRSPICTVLQERRTSTTTRELLC